MAVTIGIGIAGGQRGQYHAVSDHLRDTIGEIALFGIGIDMRLPCGEATTRLPLLRIVPMIEQPFDPVAQIACANG